MENPQLSQWFAYLNGDSTGLPTEPLKYIEARDGVLAWAISSITAEPTQAQIADILKELDPDCVDAERVDRVRRALAEHYALTQSGHAIAASAYLEWLTGRYEYAALALRTAFGDGHDNNLLQLVAKVLAVGVPSLLYPQMPALSVIHLQEVLA
ncbi:hypothetical protein V3M81_09020 [Trueperella pyogenes]|uniref:hypothetical protein n=1 Tax=Trueperella pyogenes TaxID=1661 RepID=UPI00345D1590